MAKIIDEEYWDKYKEPTKMSKFFEKLLKKPEDRHLLYLIAIGIVIYVNVYFLITLTTEDYLKSQLYLNTAFGQINLEFAFTDLLANSILAAWGSLGIQRVIFATCANFLIIASYILILVSLLLLIARRLKGKLQKFGLRMIFLPVIAGIFNSTGNILLLVMLINASSISLIIPLITSISGIIKYGFIIASIVFFIAEIIAFVLIYIKEHR